MRRLLKRLSRTSARELQVRSQEAASTAWERVRFTAGRAGWNRRQQLSGLHLHSDDLVHAVRAVDRADWGEAARYLRSHFARRPCRFVINPADRQAVVARAIDLFPGCADDARQRAAPLLEGRYDLLGYRSLSFTRDAGDRAVDWHFDPVHRRSAPREFWADVPYLQPEVVGDHKIIWELNRHQHWLALGRAAWLTGDSGYAARFVFELESWLATNPPLTGINWASMLELAFRSISWIWALHFFVALEEDREAPWLPDLLTGISRQLEHVERHLSHYFSPNTHLLGEALALYVAGRVLPELKSAARWEAAGRNVLIQQSAAQINSDGGHAELSAHYHRYALDFYLLALAVARQTGDSRSELFAQTAHRLASYCRALATDDGRLPTIGDDDGGMLFPICGRQPFDARDSLGLAAALLDRPELAVGDPPEEVFWMVGGDAIVLRRPERSSSPVSVLYLETGYAVLRSDDDHGILDVGPHGFLNGGHAHADALSLVLAVRGRPLVIDPGTATYTMDPALRDRFRSTAMHSTVTLDERSQSDPSGPFQWRTRTEAEVGFWRALGHLDYVEGAHDGYRPLVHRRGVLRTREGVWIVFDHVLGSGHHRADAHWHLDPAWSRTSSEPGIVRLIHRDGLSAFLGSSVPAWEEYSGDQDGLGWCAPVYGQLIPSLTLRFTEQREAPFSIVSVMAAVPGAPAISFRPETVLTAANDGWHRAAVSLTHCGTRLVVMAATVADGGSAGIGSAGGENRPRQRHRVVVEAGELSTDARLAALRLSPDGEPISLDLLDACAASWIGPAAFELPGLSAAQDLHLDVTALRQLSRNDGARRVG